MTYKESNFENSLIEFLIDNNKFEYIKGTPSSVLPGQVLIENDIEEFLNNSYGHLDIDNLEIKEIINFLKAPKGNSLFTQNKSIMDLLSNGTSYIRDDKTKQNFFLTFFDYDNIENNKFVVVSQMRIREHASERIPDLIVYVNGIPLVVFELKSLKGSKSTLEAAYKQLTVEYKNDIPSLFYYNAFCIVSDSVNSKMGSLFAPLKNFYTWNKPNKNDESEIEEVPAFNMLKNLLDKKTLINIVRNFVYFPDNSGDDNPDNQLKIVCRYPQYYAATKLCTYIDQNIKVNNNGVITGSGKGGVYFGATGSGKSYTMLYLVKLLRRQKQDYLKTATIVIISDRTELDQQLAEQFVHSQEYLEEKKIKRVESRNELKQELSTIRSGGIFLTTIQKFSESDIVLSERTNIICISDEAHRSQNHFKTNTISDDGKERFPFAKCLRNSLPNATYVGFTGTPIDITENIFGDIVDQYTMNESVRDGITVGIVYESRISYVNLDPEYQAEIDDYFKEMEQQGAKEHHIESAKRNVAIEHIVEHPDRIKFIAQDFVKHYEQRAHHLIGKALFVCYSRNSAVMLYDEILKLRPEWAKFEEGIDNISTKKSIAAPKIGVVASSSLKDSVEFKELINSNKNEDYARQFKDKYSNFKIAIVIDMWLTGFDVPELDTIYIDKPLQNHNLIQTISRVNRVYPGKDKGLVVDYFGIKDSMDRALVKYNGKSNNSQVQDTDSIVDEVKKLIEEINMMLTKQKVDISPFFSNSDSERSRCIFNAVNAMQRTQEIETTFMDSTKEIISKYKSSFSSEKYTEYERKNINLFESVMVSIRKLVNDDAPDPAQIIAGLKDILKDSFIFDDVTLASEVSTDIFTDEYQDKIKNIKYPHTVIADGIKKAHQLNDELGKIRVKKQIDLDKKLQELIDRYNKRQEFTPPEADNFNKEIIIGIAKIIKEAKDALNETTQNGISKDLVGYYDLIDNYLQEISSDIDIEQKKHISIQIKNLMTEISLQNKDWYRQDNSRAHVKVKLYEILNEFNLYTKGEKFNELSKLTIDQGIRFNNLSNHHTIYF